MSRKANCWEDVTTSKVAESFFKTIKVELIYRNRYPGKEEAAISIFEWMETWCNRNRRHSAIGNRTIEEFEQLINIKNAA